MKQSLFTGAGSMLRFMLRRDRIRLSVWVLAISLFTIAMAPYFADMYLTAESRAMMAAFFAQSDFTIVEEFLTLLTALIAIISTVPSVSFLMKLRSEEKHGYTEHLLARSVDKGRMFAGNFGLAVLNAVLLSVIGSVSLWAIASATIDNAPALSMIFSASFHYIPAIWVLVGLSATLIGLFSKATGIAYGYLGYCFIALFTVMMFGFPDWIERLSPYAYVPQVPLENASPVVAVVLIGIATVLSVVGFLGYKKRNAVFY